ncbi:MAG: BTAD domain-containing putative transcriptional regulator [Chloroflexota bacterium]
MPQSELKLLGTFQLTIDGRPITKFRSDKARALLAYVATEADKIHSRSYLASLLWSDLPEKSAKRNLRNVFSNLRKITPDLLEISTQSVKWVGDCHVDLHQFRKTINSNPTKAIALYEGPFLQGFSLADAILFDEWHVVWQEQLHQEMMNGLEQLVAAALSAGDAAAAIQYGKRQLALIPWYETAHRSLMEAYAMQGRRSAALEQFVRCQAVLDEELGVAPSPETMALRAKIATTAAIPHNLPPQPDLLLGREREAAQLLQAIPQQQLVTLHGVGGVGKSVLALNVVHQLLDTVARQQFPDGVWFVPMAGIEPHGNVEERLLALLALTLGVNLEGHTLALSQLATALQGKRLLVLLDNLEHVVTSVEPLLHTLLQKTELHLFITSRVQTDLPQETVISLTGLPLPTASELFRSRALGIYRGFVATDGEIEAICRQIEGLPLAIELAASWVEHLSMSELGEQINLNLAHTQTSHEPARHLSLRGVFNHSWQWLAERERILLAQLAAFRGSFGRDAVLAITNCSLSDLSSLRSKSLIRLEGAGRYSLHEMMRSFAQEKAALLELADSTCRLHSDYYLRALKGADADERRIAFDNIRVAWQYAYTFAQLALLYDSSDDFVNVLGSLGTAQEVWQELGASIAIVEQHPSTELRNNLLGLLYLHKSLLSKTVSSLPEAISYATKGLEWASDVVLQCRLHAELGHEYADLTQYDKALSHFEQQHELAHQSDDEQLKADALIQLSTHQALHFLDGYENSIVQLEALLANLLATSDPKAPIVGQTLKALAMTSQRFGDYGRAITHGLSWAAYQADVSTYEHVSALINLALSYMFAGLHTQAVEINQQGMLLAAEIEDQLGIGFFQANLCMCYRRMGELDKALQLGQQGLALLQSLNAVRIVGMTWNRLGHTLLAMGDYERAMSAFQTALTLFKENNHPNQYEARAGIAHTSTYLGQWELAREQAEAVCAFASFKTLGKVVEPLLMLVNVIIALRTLKEADKASKLNNLAHEWIALIAGRNEDEEIRAAYSTYTQGVLGKAELNVGFVQHLAIAKVD